MLEKNQFPDYHGLSHISKCSPITLILWGNLNIGLDKWKILLLDNRMRVYEILRDLCYSAFKNYLLPTAVSATRLGVGDIIVQKLPWWYHGRVRRSKQGHTILGHGSEESGKHKCSGACMRARKPILRVKEGSWKTPHWEGMFWDRRNSTFGGSEVWKSSIARSCEKTKPTKPKSIMLPMLRVQCAIYILYFLKQK